MPIPLFLIGALVIALTNLWNFFFCTIKVTYPPFVTAYMKVKEPYGQLYFELKFILSCCLLKKCMPCS